MASGALPGFRDFYPAELAERTHIVGAWREVARRFGFHEYDGPPLEPLELYTRKSGDEIVGQLYAFTDKGGREVALRPEMTPTLARMVAARAHSLRKPVRWFSIPQLFRYERQQRGRLREHFQLNVDIVGEPSELADAELLAVAVEIMRSLGLDAGDVVARVSDRRVLHALLGALGVGGPQMPAVFAAIDKIDREPRESLERRLRDAGVPQPVAAAVLDGVQADFDVVRAEFAGRAGLADHFERLERYAAALDALGVLEWMRFDLRVVRGLAYYTGIVFELFDRGGELRAICGGGRYDTLLGTLGGADLPALGFGMGDVVLGELLRARGVLGAPAAGADYWVVPADGVAAHLVLRIATALRRAGLSAEYVLNAEKLASQKARAQMQAAAKAGAHRVLLVRNERQAEIIDVQHEGGRRPIDLAAMLGPTGGDGAAPGWLEPLTFCAVHAAPVPAHG